MVELLQLLVQLRQLIELRLQRRWAAREELLGRVRETRFDSGLVHPSTRTVVVAPVVAHALRGDGAAAPRKRIPVVPMLVALELERHAVLERDIAERQLVPVEHR